MATDSRDPSGVGEHMLVLGSELKDRFDIVFACPPSPGGRPLLARAAHMGLRVKALGDDPDEIRAWLDHGRFALLHIHAGIGWEGHGLAAAARAAGIIRVVRTEHLPDLITDPEQRAAHTAGLELVDRVICVSDAAASSFRAAGVDPGRLAVIHNGLPLRLPARPRTAVRSGFGLDDSHRVILVTARFTAQKGHVTLLDALPSLVARDPGLRVWLAGAGPLERPLRRRASRLGVAHVVDFLGFRGDVPDLLAGADLFVLPSRFEGMPLAVLEAMAAGLPVVATRVGGTDEVLRDGVDGRLVEAGDAGALGATVADLLADTAAARKLGEAGRRRFGEAFTAARMADATARLYASLGVPETQDSMTSMEDARQPRTRIGFIGAGGIAHRHLGVLEGFADVELAAFADPAEDRAQEAAERFGAHAYADAEAMLAEQDLDAVYICVPPFAHGAPERAALARNLPFFVEKPLALDLDMAEDIGRAVEAAGLVTAVGYHWRYLDTVDEVKGLLAGNPARFLSGYWLDSTPPPAWWWKQDGSGGQINEQTTHIVDLARYLAGDVVQVFGLAGHTARPDFPGLDVATASTASLKFASGAVGNIGSTCLLRWNHRVGLHVFADSLAVEITDHDLMVDVGHGRPFRPAEGDPVWREDRDFIDAVRGGENRIRCPYAEALKTLRITAAITHSVETGRAVDLGAPLSETRHV